MRRQKMTNWELYNQLLQKNTCCLDHEGDEYYDYPFIYYNNVKQNKWFIRINHLKVRLDAGKGEKIETYINFLSYFGFRNLYYKTITAIQDLKEAEEWRNKLVTNSANNKTDDKICNITLNLTYSQNKGGSK